MAKIKKIILLLGLFITIFVGKNVYAVENVDFDIEAVYINSTIDLVGSMHVTEAIVINGSLNGFELGIDYRNSALKTWEAGKIDFSNSSIYNARAVSLSKVSAAKIDREDIGWDLLGKEYTEFKESEGASLGSSSVYTKTTTTDGIKIRTYNENSSGYVVFFYDYYIDQAVVLHNDVAEIYWTFIPADFDPIKKVHMQVITPGDSTQDVFRVWAHGALNGKVRPVLSDKKSDNGKEMYRGLSAEVIDINARAVDIRMTFDKELMGMANNILNNSKEEALPKIIEVEEERANDANRQRTFIKIVYYGTFVLTGMYIIGIIILWIYIYRKYDKELKIDFPSKYYREFTGDYGVEVIDYLMKKDISTNAFSASIMNLIYKKNIEVKDNPEDKDNFELVLKNKDNVSPSEDMLLNMLFTDIAGGISLKLKDLEKFSKKESTARIFMDKYNSWKDSVITNGKEEAFYENKNNPKKIGILYFVLGIILCILLAFLNPTKLFLVFLLGIMGMIFMIYCCTLKKWTPKGREHYIKWNAFKNFLEDFGSFKDKELPEIALWEKYLVYATIFGLAKKVQKAMKVKLTELGNETYINTYPTLYRDIYFGNYINNSVNHAYTGSQTTITAANAHSSMSSGSGFGGGFSSGGGFGGGGGSGHGF